MNRLDTAVLLIIHRRPDCTRRVFDAIAAARPSRLFIAADGPRTDADRALCEATRTVVERVDWECDVRRDYRERGMGLAPRVLSALEWTFASAEGAIVFEDDCVPSPDFFPFCAAMLDRYRNDSRVVHVSGESYRVHRAGDASYYFSKYPLAWGWATWRRVWARFDMTMSSWTRFRNQPEASALFDTPDEELYWRETFDHHHHHVLADRQAHGWDYSWYYHCMTAGLSIHPAVNLISNIGFDQFATHTQGGSPLQGRPVGALDDPLRHPDWLVRDRQADLDTFDIRFPGGILKQQRTLRHQIGRPYRWARRHLVGPGGAPR